MKRKYAGLLGIFICLLLLSACSIKENAGIKKNGGLSASATPIAKAETENKITTVKDSLPKLPKDAVILKGKIINKKKGTILVVDCDSKASPYALYWVSMDDAAVLDSKGNAITMNDLKAGMRIDLAYNGNVLESYPGQIGAYRVTVTKKGDDLTGFYLSVIKDIYDVDPALNEKIQMMAFDLTKVSNLSETEKNALLYCCGMEFAFETISATFEELIEQGYINQKKAYFEKGILIEIKVEKEKKNSFDFEIKKWRGGLGAYGFSDCKAKKKNSVWNYKMGGEYIS